MRRIHTLTLKQPPQFHITIHVAELGQRSIKPTALKTLPETSDWTPHFMEDKTQVHSSHCTYLLQNPRLVKGFFPYTATRAF